MPFELENYVEVDDLKDRVQGILDSSTPLDDVSLIGEGSGTVLLVYELPLLEQKPEVAILFFVEKKFESLETTLTVERFFHVAGGNFFSVNDLREKNRSKLLETVPESEYDFVQSAIQGLSTETLNQIASYESLILDAMLQAIEGILAEKISSGFGERVLEDGPIQSFGEGVMALSAWLTNNNLMYFDGTFQKTFGSGIAVTANLKPWDLVSFAPCREIYIAMFGTDAIDEIYNHLTGLVRLTANASVSERQFSIEVEHQIVTKNRTGKIKAMAILVALSRGESDLTGALLRDFGSFIRSGY